MNKKLTAFLALFLILAFIGYIIFDVSSNRRIAVTPVSQLYPDIADSWRVAQTYHAAEGELSTVAVSQAGTVFLGGNSFIRVLDSAMNNLWSIKTDMRITSLAIWGDTLFASTQETILLYSTGGKFINEWGPYESKSIITSVAADNKYVAFADAGNRLVYILKKNGELSSMLGQADDKFILPSAYFDVSLTGNENLNVANTGHRRIETWTTSGRKISQFGEAGVAPGAFCGCCNPAHFAVIPQGYVTAEKGINRIKIVGPAGEFIEYVSSKNDFKTAYPLDVASADGKTIYAVNSINSNLYVFKRIN